MLLGALLVGCGGTARVTPSTPHIAKKRLVRHVRSARPAPLKGPAQLVLRLPRIEQGPVPGYLLIADRDNNRIILVSPSGRVVWRFPGSSGAGTSFAGPDDAFFTPGYRRIVTNEEFNDTVAQIDIGTRRIIWTYGRAGVPGSGPGELAHPDDAYVLPSGELTVADIENCRVLRLSAAGRVLGGIGSAGRCAHDPPRALVSPNGDTPLPDGGLLVTEIGGYVDRFDAHGRLQYSVRTPTTYPSDAQLLPDGNILVAGFNTPGRVDILRPDGQIVWTYGPSSGPGALDRPSLAVRWPNGMIAVTDDWHHRVVVIDPRTKQIVWQYGHDGVASSADGYLSKPDGLDLLPSAFASAGAAPPRRLAVSRIGSLPVPASRISAVALPDGRILAAGGLTSAGSSRQVLAGPPGNLRTVGSLPVATHDAALALLGESAYLLGGGQEVSTATVFRIDTGTGASRRAGSLGEPLSDLGAATIGGRTYVVGGYTGAKFASAVLRFRPGHAPVLVARLPNGLRYAGVASLGGLIYVAGGVTTAGESSAVLAIDPRSWSVREVATLPGPVAHAPLVAFGNRLFLVGGTDASGTPVAEILAIDPRLGRVSVAASLPSPLADAAAVAVGGRIVVLGGEGSAPSNAVLALRQASPTK